MRSISRLIGVLLFLAAVYSAGISGARAASLGEYSGRYTDGADYSVTFSLTKYGLVIRPVLWTASQLLARTEGDKFQVVDRTTRGAEFIRDPSGQITGVKVIGMEGEGLTLQKGGPPIGIELLLSGHSLAAAPAYRDRGADGESAAIKAASDVLERLPSKASNVVAFLEAMSPALAHSAAYHTLLAAAYVATNQRSRAMAEYQKALTFEPANADAVSGLFRLGAMPSAPIEHGGWQLPFPLDGVFQPPTPAEVRSVEADWSSRDLSPRDVRTEYTDTIRINQRTMDVRIVSHLVHGSRHYGAIITPQHATARSRPVIIDAKGVSPSYFPLDLDKIESIGMLGDLADRFVYVVPSFRGEVLNFKGHTFTSEGDRRDALDGATDDAIALLNVALQMTPEADSHRICAFGHSRGGTVALLLGVRDQRVKCVVDVAGPVDWFQLMGTEGWTEQELWREAVRTHADPEHTGGQDLERFLGRAIEGKADLAAVRHNMIASSPLYFAGRLRNVQLHYGLEDPSVPIRNARALITALITAHVPQTRFQTHLYPTEGHDTDRINMPPLARTYLRTSLRP